MVQHHEPRFFSLPSSQNNNNSQPIKNFVSLDARIVLKHWHFAGAIIHYHDLWLWSLDEIWAQKTLDANALAEKYDTFPSNPWNQKIREHNLNSLELPKDIQFQSGNPQNLRKLRVLR